MSVAAGTVAMGTVAVGSVAADSVAAGAEPAASAEAAFAAAVAAFEAGRDAVAEVRDDLAFEDWPAPKRLAPHAIARLGIVRSFQINSIFTHLSVLDNVKVSLESKTALPSRFWLSSAGD